MAQDFGKDDGKRLEVLKDMQVDAAQAIDRALHPDPEPPPDTKGSWKVLVYMAAYGALRPFAERDLFEMCMVENSPNAKFSIVARVHWEEGKSPSTFPIAHGQGNNIRFQQNGPDPKPMARDFEAFLQAELPPTTDGNGHPHRCLLILWGHAIDTQFGGFGPNGMTLSEVAAAMRKARPGPRPVVNVLGFDACDMSRVETLQTLGGLASSLLASQISVPYSGWPYHTILRRLNTSTGMDDKELSRMAVKEYVDSYRPPRVTLTALHGGFDAQYEKLAGTINIFVQQMDVALTPELMDLVRDTFNDARVDSGDPLLDVREFCVALRDRVQRSQSQALIARKAGLVAAIDAVIEVHDDIIVDHGRRGPLVTGLNGIGISPYQLTQKWSGEALGIYERVGWRRPQGVAQPVGSV